MNSITLSGGFTMSAFIVSDYHIHALLNFAITRRENVHVYQHQILINRQTTTARLSEIGQILLNENYRSVNSRYTGNDTAPAYKFKRLIHSNTPVEILKACSCYDYQACETDDYNDTLAAHIIDAIRRAAINSLPGYDAAPWGLDEPPIEKNRGECFLIGARGLEKI
jgi:hypothetical protein